MLVVKVIVFFRAVSHQLCGDLGYHLDIRAAGVAYMRDNLERFIESNIECSWLQYLNNMSMQGTWADNLIMQAVADQLKLRIVIVESNENFRDVNYVQAVSLIPRLTDVFLGHLGEYHYVSTVPISANYCLLQNQNKDLENLSENVLTKTNNTSTKHTDINVKNNRKAYMREYMKTRRANKNPETREKNNEYMREYMKTRQANKNPETKEKDNKYMRDYMKTKRANKNAETKGKK